MPKKKHYGAERMGEMARIGKMREHKGNPKGYMAGVPGAKDYHGCSEEEMKRGFKKMPMKPEMGGGMK